MKIPADIPDDLALEQSDESDLPRDWRAYPGPDDLRQTGTDFVRRGEHVGLIVPTAVIDSEESNLLLNPLQPEMQRVTIGEPEPYVLDARLLRA